MEMSMNKITDYGVTNSTNSFQVRQAIEEVKE
jgi:hypothetical protein